MLKAYLSTQTSSLSAFMTSKTHIVAQKPHGLQLNAKECSGSNSAILLSFFVQTTLFNNDNTKVVQVFTLILAQNQCLSQHGAL